MKITGDTTCPNCKKDHEVTLDIDKLDIKQPISTLNNMTAAGPAPITTQILEAPRPEIKIVTKIPSYIPKYKCKDCNENHKNKNYTQKPKFKCSNCDQFSPDGKSCLFCDKKEFEDVTDEDLQNLGIEEPVEHEHEET